MNAFGYHSINSVAYPRKGVRVIVQRLRPQHREAVNRLLSEDPVQNLYLLHTLACHGIENGRWYGAFLDQRLCGVVRIHPGVLAVPWIPHDSAAHPLGQALAIHHRPCMVVGPRAHCDRLWKAWCPQTPIQCHQDQHLYVVRSVSTGDMEPNLRLARPDEAALVAHHAGAMQEEDIGSVQHRLDPAAHIGQIQARIRAKRYWIKRHDNRITFQACVSLHGHRMCQIGGTYVPPSSRGEGLATRCIRTLCQTLLAELELISLHVNEANTTAIRCYQRAGFVASAPFRLTTVPP